MQKQKPSFWKGITVEPKQFQLVLSSGIKVYPVFINHKTYIQVDNNGKIKTYDKPISQSEINDAIAKTIIHFYNQLNQNKK